jgi:anthranilate phosphoribosyltransferase
MDAFKPLIAKVATGATLSREEAEGAFDRILSGGSTPAQCGAFLMALRVRGETVDEIFGAVSAMRARMLPVNAPADAIDIVGTGGDNIGTWNISTLAAIIVAAAGVPVAKHGNRAASSKSGSADVLGALGVRVGLAPDGVEHCLRTAGLAFMMAPSHHASMRHVAPVRTELGTRTIFNLLGPLANPARVRRLVVGVFSPAWLEPIAEALLALGIDRAMVVHGHDGLDEITTTGPTMVVRVARGRLHRETVTPDAAGLPTASLEALRGAGPVENASALRAVLGGARNAYRDIAVLNAAGGLMVADDTLDLRGAVTLAEQALDSGKAAVTLETLITASVAASGPAGA